MKENVEKTFTKQIACKITKRYNYVIKRNIQQFWFSIPSKLYSYIVSIFQQKRHTSSV